LLRDHHVPGLRALIVVGEKLETEIMRLWFQTGCRVFNAYGPTETTVCASCDLPVPEDEQPAIGEPLDNVHMYVLDPWLNPLPNGITGEFHIGGVGVGRGYAQQPTLMAERFLPDLFSPVPGVRMYRTGGLGKRLVSGSVRECIYFGVPQIVYPMGFDQPGAAIRVQYHGLGVVGSFRGGNRGRRARAALAGHERRAIPVPLVRDVSGLPGQGAAATRSHDHRALSCVVSLPGAGEISASGCYALSCKSCVIPYVIYEK
jgi:hypothetical protein